MNRLVREILEDVVQRRVGETTVARAEQLLDEGNSARRRRLKKTLERRKGEATEAELKLERHQVLVARVRLRDHGRCQLCTDRRPEKPHDPIDPHHLEHGAGKSRGERMENMLLAHRSCHEAYHANVRAFVARVKAWCRRHGYPLPRRKEYRDA